MASQAGPATRAPTPLPRFSRLEAEQRYFLKGPTIVKTLQIANCQVVPLMGRQLSSGGESKGCLIKGCLNSTKIPKVGIPKAGILSVAAPAEPRGEKKTFFCANFGR